VKLREWWIGSEDVAGHVADSSAVALAKVEGADIQRQSSVSFANALSRVRPTTARQGTTWAASELM